MALKKFIIRPPGPPFRFLDLPPELRNRIYESLFLGLRMELWWATYIRRDNGSACERTCWTAYPPLYLEEDETDDFPPMLYVNRQIRAECIGLFFESALWGSEHGIWLVVRWLRALPQRYISAIKRLRFPIGGTGHKVQMLSEVLDDYSIELRGFEMTDMGDGWVLCEKRSEDAKILLLELDCGSPAHRQGVDDELETESSISWETVSTRSESSLGLLVRLPISKMKLEELKARQIAMAERDA